MNKHWGDKADKDLFFTLLSIKDVGVITAPEWAIVGSAMRMMGYGFTNEGCRQHFQALRRTQYKSATASNLLPDGRFRHDPAQNPVTRRPGPGRGRPRKNARVLPGTIPIEPLPEGVRIVSVGPRQLRPAPSPGDVAPVQIQTHGHLMPQYGPPPPGHGVPIHHGLPLPARSALPSNPGYRPPPAVTGHPLPPATENDDALGEDEPPSKRPRVDDRETNSTIANLALAASSQLEEESADDMEDDDEEEEELFGGEEGPESSVIGPADEDDDEDEDDASSNHETEAAVLMLVAADNGPPAAASNASSSSWGTPPEAESSTRPS